MGAYMLISRYEFGGNQFSTEKLFDIGNFNYTEQMLLGDMIALPMPVNLSDETSAMWADNQEMTVGKEVAMTLANNLGISSSSIGNTVIRNRARSKGVLLAKANVLNYEGTATKSHSFSWVMIPQSKLEADNIEKIIDTFEKGMLSNLKGKDNTLQFYPDLFRIQTKGNMNRLAYLPCVIESVSGQWSDGDSFQVMADGNFPYYQLNVTFKEITNRTKDTYEAIKNGILI